jgi:hypothetical protein
MFVINTIETQAEVSGTIDSIRAGKFDSARKKTRSPTCRLSKRASGVRWSCTYRDEPRHFQRSGCHEFAQSFQCKLALLRSLHLLQICLSMTSARTSDDQTLVPQLFYV